MLKEEGCVCIQGGFGCWSWVASLGLTRRVGWPDIGIGVLYKEKRREGDGDVRFIALERLEGNRFSSLFIYITTT